MSPATRSAASCLTSARTTCTPCCAKIRALCSPMPDPAPVTKPIFLSKRNTCDSFLLHYAHYSDLPGCLSLDCLPFVDKKIGFVTGAGSGIGEQIARIFAQQGAHVVLADVRQDAAERVAGEIQAAGGSARAQQLDVAERSQGKAALRQIVGREGARHVP